MDSQIDFNSIRKNFYCSKLTLLQSFYCLEWNMFTGGCLFDYWHILTHVITLLSQCVNALIHLFIVFYCLLKFARNIENTKYYIKRHIASLEHYVSCNFYNNFFKPILYILLSTFIRMIDVPGFENRLCLVDFNVCKCSTLNGWYIKIHDLQAPRPLKVTANFKFYL